MHFSCLIQILKYRSKMLSLIIIYLIMKVSNVDSVNMMNNLPYCQNEVSTKISRGQLYISTLDGRVTALNILTGKHEWETKPDPGPLLSSSIHNLELINNGLLVRWIPSLKGSIYEFDGEYISRISVTADDLLNSSFKFSDNLEVIGGKETRSYGISVRSGQIIYECSVLGCLNNTYNTEETSNVDTLNYISNENSFVDDEIVVVKRQTKTIRLIEPKNGLERWNFSVGHHELEILKTRDCQSSLSQSYLSSWNIFIKTSITEGKSTISAYNNNNPNVLLWEYRLNVPIANMWRTDTNDNLMNIDVYYPDATSDFQNHKLVSSTIYLGIYKSQLYVQEPNYFQILFDRYQINSYKLIEIETPLKFLPVVKNVESISNGDEFFLQPYEQTNFKSNLQIEETKNTALSIFQQPKQSNIYNFYLKSNCNSIKNDWPNINGSQFEYPYLIDIDNTPVEIIIISLWFWWKEIVVISLTTALIVNLFLPKMNRGQEILIIERRIITPIEAVTTDVQSSTSLNSQNRNENSMSNASFNSNFVSRFHMDFDIIRCIGKGGFGIVFEAKNKLDDCNYAVKKIVLPNKIEKRNRVMREVKTLANCEHHNIVRYFQAWIETPPPGWRENSNWEKNRDSFSLEWESTNANTVSSQNEITKNSSKKSFKEISDLDKSHSININSENSWDDSFEIEFKPYSQQSEELSFEKDCISNSCNKFKKFESNSIIEASISSLDIQINNKKNCNDLFEIESKPCSGSENITSIIETHSISNSYNKFNNLESNAILQPLANKSNMNLNNADDLLINSTQNKMYLYIQMQLCKEQSLRDWLCNNTLDKRIPNIQVYFEQIVDAVHYVHQKGLIHRDLKPSNIFFSLNGQIKIGDFGLVALMPDIHSKNNYNGLNLNKNKFIDSFYKHTERVGTYLYMSPEQLKGKPYDNKVDIYSLGFIFAEMLVYFNTEMERITTLMALRNGQFSSLFSENFPEELMLLKEMLSSEAVKRPSASEIKQSLSTMISWTQAKTILNNIRKASCEDLVTKEMAF